MTEEKIDIMKILKENAPKIDRAIEKYIPRSYDKGDLEEALGKPRYSYNIEGPNKAVAEPIWNLLDRGGKRWRPTLFLLLVEALGKNPDEYVDFSIIPEVVHNGTLIVDDIEDNSEERRNKPCVHKIFGVDIAVNCGNAMYYLPILTLMKNQNKFDDKTLIKAYEVYIEEMLHVSFGQAMDIWWHTGKGNADAVTEQEYMQMCAYKTGCLARMGAKLGATLAGGTDEQIEAAGHYAESIGVAFQIQDDILDLTASSEDWGKKVGGDITEGKRTLMVIHALKNAPQDKADRLKEILRTHTKDSNMIKEAIETIKEAGSIEYAKEFARNMINKSWQEIDRVLPDSEAKKKIRAFSEFLVERKL
jgi:geranylgeranyl pyrophosphate synthase